MREIKFKAKRVSDGEWVEGSYYKAKHPLYASESKHYIIKQQYLYRTSSDGCNMRSVYDANEIDPNTLCQFTGLVDRNGREIYEGDKMTVNENVNGTIKPYDVSIKYSGSGFVIYNPDCCNICRDGYGCICSLDEAMCLGEIDVIGNIHDK